MSHWRECFIRVQSLYSSVVGRLSRSCWGSAVVLACWCVGRLSVHTGVSYMLFSDEM